MQQNIFHIFNLYICLSSFFVLSNSKALVGENLRFAIDEEYPYITSISIVHPTRNDRFMHFCMGTLISNRHVVTAFHCLINRTLDQLRVGIGAANLLNTFHVKVLWWLSYDEWATTNNVIKMHKKNDIAVLRLERNVTQAIAPIELTKVKSSRLVNCDVWIAGWGRIEDESRPTNLQTGILSIIGIDECRHKIVKAKGPNKDNPYHVEDNMFCTYTEPYLLAHRGDSGAPILYSNTLVGITSAVCPFPEEPLNPKKVNLHTSIYYYRYFLYDIIENR